MGVEDDVIHYKRDYESNLFHENEVSLIISLHRKLV